MTPGLLGEMVRVAIGEVSSHRLRSTVTGLAVAAAVFAVVVLGSFARSGIASLMKGIEDMGGARLLVVFDKPEERRQAGIAGRPLSPEDGEAIASRVPHVRRVSGLELLGPALAWRSGDQPFTTDVLAGDPALLATLNLPLQAGRNLAEDDLRQRRPVVVLGSDVCGALFARCPDALGQVVRLGDGVYKVIGVIQPIKRFGANMGFDWNGFALIPRTLDRPPSMLLLVTEGAAFHPDIQARTRRLLSGRHQFTEDFDLFDFGTLIKTLRSVFKVLEWMLAMLVGVALVVAAFGIFNAQTASFRQRILDSGIRLALGAPRGLLAAQMVFEAAALALLGSALGAGLGTAGSALSGRFIERLRPGWVTMTAYDLAGAACIAALLVGCGSGLLPALRAMRLDVVDCLRSR